MLQAPFSYTELSHRATEAERLDYFKEKTLTEATTIAALSIRYMAWGELEWLLLFQNDGSCVWSAASSVADPEVHTTTKIPLNLDKLRKFSFVVSESRHPGFFQLGRIFSHRPCHLKFCSDDITFSCPFYFSHPDCKEWLERKGLLYIHTLIERAITTPQVS